MGRDLQVVPKLQDHFTSSSQISQKFSLHISVPFNSFIRGFFENFCRMESVPDHCLIRQRGARVRSNSRPNR